MNMFSKAFQEATRDLDGKTLDQQIVQGGRQQKFLGEGDHDVRIAGIDCNNLQTQGRITVKWEGEGAREHRDGLFVVEQDRKTGKWGLHWKFTKFLGSLIPSPEAYDAFLAECNNGNTQVFDLLVGLHARITNARGKGYGPVESLPSGGYQVRDTVSGDVVAQGATIDAVQKAAEDKGYKRAYINTVAYIATHADDNIARFSMSMAALHQPKQVPFFGGAGQKKAVGDNFPF
jgi:hypothetical protein